MFKLISFDCARLYLKWSLCYRSELAVNPKAKPVRNTSFRVEKVEVDRTVKIEAKRVELECKTKLYEVSNSDLFTCKPEACNITQHSFFSSNQ